MIVLSVQVTDGKLTATTDDRGGCVASAMNGMSLGATDSAVLSLKMIVHVGPMDAP